MRRLSVLAAVCLLLLALCAGTAAAAARPSTAGSSVPVAPSWAEREIETVVAAGLLAPDVERFRPDDDLTRGELFDALVLMGYVPPLPLDPSAPVTMRELDAKLVAALDLGRAAWRLRTQARDAGLEPTPYLGTETVARLLGLRINHPQTEEWLERGPNMPASRAEAALSLARMLSLAPERITAVQQLAESFTLPPLSDWQTAVLTRGLKFVGFPYVWAGTSERRQRLWGAGGVLVDAPAGFDCSGFVWRVYKTVPFTGAPQLSTVLRGRTTYQMSGEVPASMRYGVDKLQPGDVIFFGSRGPASKPTQVGHAGIFVGNGWFVHSSGNGVTLQPLEGWYRTSFAWGRRPIVEAGLT